MRAVQIRRFGGPEVIHLTDVETPKATKDQVLVEVHASTVNFSDILQREGVYPGGPVPPFVSGLEAAGTIISTGARVALLAPGAHAEVVAVQRSMCLPLDPECSFEDGAAIPLSFLTAYHALVDCARAEPGETVLIHAGAGGLGSAAIQIAVVLGLEVVATASTASKRDFALSLGAARVHSYEGFRSERPDLVLDSVGGRVLAESVRLLPPLGRVVCVGNSSREDTPLNHADLIHRSRGIIGFHLSSLLRHPGKAAEGMQALRRYLQSGKVRPIVGHCLPMEQVKEAHALIASRASQGKIVLRVKS
ncbi:MAG: zinc-binding dehydrogenase [Myxococcales bacterium]|nr:zinc-binding dehydrogenase [Myxococcales bacterium]